MILIEGFSCSYIFLSALEELLCCLLVGSVYNKKSAYLSFFIQLLRFLSFYLFIFCFPVFNNMPFVSLFLLSGEVRGYKYL